MRPEVAPWWRQTQADLDTARVNAAADRHYAASWFAQQAVEKGLKALYIEQKGALAPRTHDLDALARAVTLPDELSSDVALVNPAFDMVRYPDALGATAPVDVVTSELAAQHLAAAERILAWLATQLP